jgi:hypothetical protein
MHLSDEAITPLRECFNEARMLGGLVQCLAQTPEDGIQVVVEIDENVGVPQTVPQFLAGDKFSRMLEENSKQDERFVAERDLDAALVQLARSRLSPANSLRYPVRKI